MAKFEQSSESTKSEIDGIKVHCASLETKVVKLFETQDKTISEAVALQSNEQDHRVWKLTAGTCMQLTLDSCRRNLLVIGMKADWDPNASSFEIYGKFAKNDLKLTQDKYSKMYPQDVDI